MSCMARKGNAAVCPQCGNSERGPENLQQLPPRTILENKYVIGRALGQGGFGITYLAYDLVENRKLAIKEYFPLDISTRSLDHLTVSPISTKNRSALEYGLAKFAEEARALSNFRNHPGVVSFLNFLYANNTAYIVMAYVEGEDLKEYLNHHDGKKIPFESALQIVLLVMAALEDVHRAGIVHRDISPDNIYIETKGGVKILDFGATRQAMGEQSRSLSVVLKPGYAPEEQYRGKGKQGPWTDIYALGATFYRSITGRVPPEALDRLVEDDLLPPSALGIEIPPYAQEALLTALAVKAVDRFQTVTAFRQALVPQRSTPHVLAEQPVEAVVPAPVETKPSIRVQKPVIPEHPVPAVYLPKVFLLASISTLFLTLLVAAGSEGAAWVQITALLILFSMMMFVFAQMWRSIQDGVARTKPDSAVAYCFIPIFNLYWAFPVLWGFAKEYNSFLQRHGRTGERLNENLFLGSSIVYVAGCIAIPFGGLLAWVAVLLNACFLLPVVATICDAVNGLANTASEIEVPTEKLFSLYCVADGEYQGQVLNVNGGGFIIGRNPKYASVVLSSDEISGQHVRVWQDAANAGVWIEDMHSTNGTYCSNSRSGDNSAEWIPVVGSKLLFVGDRFRLSKDGAEFEVQSV